MKRSGAADLPLHYGYVPQWLYERMAKLGLAITESIISEYGKNEFLRKMSDPFWFQSFGAVMGMDWHSSGITTSVLGSLKRAVNPHAKEFGIYICGGKGKQSTGTPQELQKLGDSIGFNATELIRCSKLTAKVDSVAIQDGFQLYTHNFILSDTGNWAVIQQGMKTKERTARRYHWHSNDLVSFLEEPHSGICGENQGIIFNLTDPKAAATKSDILAISKEKPDAWLRDIRYVNMPSHHEVQANDINLKRLGTVLWMAHEQKPENFEELLLLKGVGPRTVQSLALVSEVIHGNPSRFNDPARFSFAHGGKDGHPFPVPLKVYDETIDILQTAVHKAKIGHSEKSAAFKKLHTIISDHEKNLVPNDRFDELIEKERADSWKYGGRTVFGKAKPPSHSKTSIQLKLDF